MNETPACRCACGAGPSMVFACSGAADVGAVTDLAAREVMRERRAFMCCTAAIAARIEGITAKARSARRIVVLDGCPERCARKILEQAGFPDFDALELSGLGMQKGRTPPTTDAVGLVLARVRALLPLPGEPGAAGRA